MIDGNAFGELPSLTQHMAGPSGFAGGSSPLGAGMFAAQPHGMDWKGALAAAGSSLMQRHGQQGANPMMQMLLQHLQQRQQPTFGGGPMGNGAMTFGTQPFAVPSYDPSSFGSDN